MIKPTKKNSPTLIMFWKTRVRTVIIKNYLQNYEKISFISIVFTIV